MAKKKKGLMEQFEQFSKNIQKQSNKRADAVFGQKRRVKAQKGGRRGLIDLSFGIGPMNFGQVSRRATRKPLIKQSLAKQIQKRSPRKQKGILDQPIFKQQISRRPSVIGTQMNRSTRKGIFDQPFMKQMANQTRVRQHKPGKSKHPVSTFMNSVPRKSKIKSSSYTITGYMTEEQRPAAFAKMKERGTYDPTKISGKGPTYSKEDKKWIRWIAKGKVGPSPYEKEKLAATKKAAENLGIGELIETKKDPKAVKKGVQKILDAALKDSIESWKGSKVASIRADTKEQGATTDLYKRCKGRAIDQFRKEGKSIPKEDSYEMRREIMLQYFVIQEVGMKHPKGASLGVRNEVRNKIHKIIAEDEKVLEHQLTVTPIPLKDAVRLGVEETRKDIKLGIDHKVGIPDLGRPNILTKKKIKVYKKSKDELREEKDKERERKRMQHLEQERIRQEKIERRRAKPKATDKPKFDFTPKEGETPIQKIRREQREAEAKKKAKKAKKEIRYQKKGKKGFFNL